MTAANVVVRDERTVAVENASYRFACSFMAFSLLLDVIYRSLVRQEQPWDLMAIVILGGAVSAGYQWRHKILTGRSIKLVFITFGASFVVAAIVAASIAAFRVLK